MVFFLILSQRLMPALDLGLGLRVIRPAASVRHAFVFEIVGELSREVSSYSIRYTMARHLRTKGVPVWEVSAQLGHKSREYSAAEIYAPFDPAYLATLVSEIDQYLKELLMSPDRRPLKLPVR